MVYWILKAILKPIFLALYRVRAEGREHLPKKGGAIIASNHLSFLDSFFIPLVLRWRKITFLAKADYFKSWKTAWFFRMAAQIPLERTGNAKSERALKTAVDMLRRGGLLGIYPEGTRSKDGKLYRGRTGVARLAIEAGVPVIPCGLSGTNAVMPREAKLPRLRPKAEVVVRFGPPIDVSGYAGKERDAAALRALTDKIMSEIQKLSGQEYKEEYASLPRRGRRTARGDEELGVSDEMLAG